MKKQQASRHGDVGILTNAKLPKGAKRIDPKACRCGSFEVCAKHYVFAHGEVSGHAHRCDATKNNLAFYEDEVGNLYVENLDDQPAILAQTNGVQTIMDIAHLEKCYQMEGLHAPIKEAIPGKGVCQVIYPMEANWWTGEIERARD